MFVIRHVRFYASKCSKKENLHKKRVLHENMDISFFEKLIMCNNDKIKHEISKPMFDCVNEAEGICNIILLFLLYMIMYMYIHIMYTACINIIFNNQLTKLSLFKNKDA